MHKDLLWLATGAGCAAVLTLFFVAGGASVFQERLSWISRETESAATFFAQSITATQIRQQYHSVTSRKVRVLIVPGHQPESGGTEFKSITERDLVVDIADVLATLLSKNQRYEVMVARSKVAWHPTLQSYFETQTEEIEAFRASQQLLMKKYLADGSILPAADQVYHNAAPSLAARQLYGINRWTSEQQYDITLHLHLNDHAGRRSNVVGRYEGFAIYVPDHQYSNAAASKAIAEALAVRLNTFHATSTLPKEDVGVVEDQELIAIGSNNTADNAALLIEYGYIYEPQFVHADVRGAALADYAYATYLGLQDFFEDPMPSQFGSLSLPYDWSSVTSEEGASGAGIYALQTALRYLGYYPPSGKGFSDCPISGRVGPCTRAALQAYQRAQGLETTGAVGPKTRAALERDTVY